MRPTKVNPTPSVSRNPFEQNPSSSRGPGVSDPSSPKDSFVPDSSDIRGSFIPVPISSSFPLSSKPSSPGGSLFHDPSSPRSSFLRDPSSPRVISSLQPNAPRDALIPDDLSSRSSVASVPSSSRSFLEPGSYSPKHNILHVQKSSKSMEPDLLSVSSSIQQTPLKEKDRVSKTKNDDNPNWPFPTFILLFICLLLLSMMSLMSVKVHELKKKSEDQRGMMKLQILILSEELKDLQLGKAQTCTMCKVRWAQQADQCFFFSDITMSWLLSKRFCTRESSTLASVETKEEMDFLKHESNKQFYLHHGKHQYHKFWIALGYDSAINLTLGDGTLLDLVPSAVVGPNPCVYLQNGKFFTDRCHMAFYFICKTRVKFGWI